MVMSRKIFTPLYLLFFSLALLASITATAQSTNSIAMRRMPEKPKAATSGIQEKIGTTHAAFADVAQASFRENAKENLRYKEGNQPITNCRVQAIDAQQVGKAVQLTWKTDIEIDVVRYLVERTIDGIHFNTVGNVVPKSNDMNAQSYALIDSMPLNGTSMYCVTTFDSYGEKICWGFARIDLDEKPTLNIFPNPGKQENVLVEMNFLTESTIDWVLVNSEGTVSAKAEHQPVTNGRCAWALCNSQALKPGIYILRIAGRQHNFIERILIY
jgi:hypothetical protein